MQQILSEQIRQEIEPLLTAAGVELVDLVLVRQRRRPILRFLVDKPAGITLDECAQLNRRIGERLDQSSTIEDSYVLEVASPGLDRPLVATRDFQRCLGKLTKFALHRPVEGKNVWIAVIDQVDEEKVVVRTESAEKFAIARADIAWAKLEIGD